MGQTYSGMNRIPNIGQPMPPTPAPSPPPNMAKPKKQQYQTDQSRPFVFPFAAGIRLKKLVPFAIDEADRLYAKHLYIPVSLYQMWRTREECILDESGLQNMPASRAEASESSFGGSSIISLASGDRRFSMTAAPSPRADENVVLPDVSALNDAIAQAEARIKAAEISGDHAEKRKAKERREDLMRLKRVEIIYVRCSLAPCSLKSLMRFSGVCPSNTSRMGPRTAQVTFGYRQRYDQQCESTICHVWLFPSGCLISGRRFVHFKNPLFHGFDSSATCRSPEPAATFVGGH